MVLEKKIKCDRCKGLLKRFQGDEYYLNEEELDRIYYHIKKRCEA